MFGTKPVTTNFFRASRSRTECDSFKTVLSETSVNQLIDNLATRLRKYQSSILLESRMFSFDDILYIDISEM
jgi:hypothetical protein